MWVAVKLNILIVTYCSTLFIWFCNVKCNHMHRHERESELNARVRVPRKRESTLVKVIFSYQSVIDIDFALTKLEYHNKNIGNSRRCSSNSSSSSNNIPKKKKKSHIKCDQYENINTRAYILWWKWGSVREARRHHSPVWWVKSRHIIIGCGIKSVTKCFGRQIFKWTNDM